MNQAPEPGGRRNGWQPTASAASTAAIQRPSQVEPFVPDHIHPCDAHAAAGRAQCAFGCTALRRETERAPTGASKPLPCCRVARSASGRIPSHSRLSTFRRRIAGNKVESRHGAPPAGTLRSEEKPGPGELAVEAGDRVCRARRTCSRPVRVEGVGEGVAPAGPRKCLGGLPGPISAIFGGSPRPHWIEKSRTPSRASITSSPPLPKKTSSPGWPSICWRGRRRSGRRCRRSPPCPRRCGERWTLWQPLIASIQAAWPGKEI